MSDTPRTDAEALKSRPPFTFVTRKFAEELERECNQRKADWNKACDEQEAMTAKAVGWQNQAELNARLLVECREKAERYRLEANAMMAQRDEARRKVSELQAGLDDIEEYGTEEINAAVDLRHQLATALVECGELKSEKEANHQCLLMLERDIYKAREERDKAISVAERLIEYAHECLVKLESWGQGYQRYEDDMERIREDIAAYNMMKETLK